MLIAIQYQEVTQIKLSRLPEAEPPFCVSAYFVDGLLVDSGLSYTVEELVDFFKNKQIKTVVNTHHHEDHIAANVLLKERYGVELLAHQLAVDQISQPAILYPYQEDIWGYPVPSQVKEIGDHVSTPHFRFEVIYTPGHDRDHICLFEKSKGWLFAGDLFSTTHPVAARPQEDQWQLIADLKKVKGLDPQLLFPATGRKAITEPVAALRKTIKYLEELGGKIMELSRQGLSPEQIVQHIFGSESPMAEPTQQQFSSLNLVKSFLRRAN